MTGDNTLIHSHGINRRDFMKLCAALAATMGLSSKAAAEMAESVTNPQRPPVIWIGAQECTGCTESLLRATHPTVENLVLETISLEYHEVLSAAFGHQVEENKHNALEKYKGQYVLVVDGSIPLKDNGIYCMVAGEPIVDHIRKAAEGAAAIIAIGSCSAWGGVAAAGVNPTGAVSLQEVLPGKTVINIPGCPPNPHNFLATVAHIITYGKPPKLDDKNRPTFAYGRLIHEHCERRPHFDAGRFAKEPVMKATAKAGACTTSAVKGQKLTAIAQRCNSVTLAVCGRWRLVTRAMAVTKKVSASIKASISLPTSKIRLRVHRNRTLTLKKAATSLRALLVCSAVWLGWLPVSA